MSTHPGNLQLHFNGSLVPASTPLELQSAVSDLLIGLLGDIERRLRESAGDGCAVGAALDELFLALQSYKQSASEIEWRDFVATCRKHPLLPLLHLDPFTARAYHKPRGYAGDAVMMDFIYGREERWAPPAAEVLGQAIFAYTTSAPASEGVRARRAFVASLIDRLAERCRQPHVMAIAAGHLREVNMSAAARRDRLGRYVALDADLESLMEIDRCYGANGVETVHSHLRGLVNGKLQLGQFDLVYTTGLFDYLEQPLGRRLVSSMFQMLRPGGTLLVANFLPAIRDIGYMEAFMDWRLIYRTRRDMIELTMEVPESQIQEVRLFTDESQNILFLQVTRN